MKYPYIQLDPIIAEVQAQLKTLTSMGKFQTDDCFNYAIHCLRKLQKGAYETVEGFYELHNHRLKLPTNFYLFTSVWECCPIDYTSVLLPGYYSSPSGTVWKKNRPLRPADAVTLSYCNPNCVTGIDAGTPKYTFKSPSNVFACDLRSGIIYIEYQALKQDDQGNYLIPDEEHTIEAVKNYIKLQVLEEDYYLQRLPRYIYVDLQRNYEDAFRDAQNALEAMGPDEIDHMIDLRQKEMNRFKL